MMHEFLTAHRDDLIRRCRQKAAVRSAPGTPEAEHDHGIAPFLDQLIKTLIAEAASDPNQIRKVSGEGNIGNKGYSEMSDSAARHGGELMRRGFTAEQVVHDYGDLCQSITDLAYEIAEPINVDEFRTLNRCLDNAIAMAVTEFNYQRDFVVADQHADTLNIRLGFFAHELRNHLYSATLALSAIREGNLGISGATGTVLDRSLVGLRVLIDRSLSDVRMLAGVPVHNHLFSLAEFIAELKLSGSLEASVKGNVLIVPAVDLTLAIDADRDLMLSAVGNLLQNAFKYTHNHTTVTLSAYAQADRIIIDVEDHCGGLPPGDAEKMFHPFIQNSDDRTGLGLGLTISRRSVEANQGILSVRDVPGSGCIFTIDMPRRSVVLPA